MSHGVLLPKQPWKGRGRRADLPSSSGWPTQKAQPGSRLRLRCCRRGQILEGPGIQWGAASAQGERVGNSIKGAAWAIITNGELCQRAGCWNVHMSYRFHEKGRVCRSTARVQSFSHLTHLPLQESRVSELMVQGSVLEGGRIHRVF